MRSIGNKKTRKQENKKTESKEGRKRNVVKMARVDAKETRDRRLDEVWRRRNENRTEARSKGSREAAQAEENTA